MREYIQKEDIPEHFLEGSGARYKTEGLPVVEYELEDVPKLLSRELPWVFGLVQTQPNSEGGGSTWYRFTPEAEKVWQEMPEAKKATYWHKVEAQLEAEKRSFERKQRNSPNPLATLQREIEFVTWQLYPNDNKDTPARLGCNPQAHFGQSAARLLRGERTFDNINLHYHQIQAEVAFKYLDWLKELQANGGEAQAKAVANGKKLSYQKLALLLSYERVSVSNKTEAKAQFAKYPSNAKDPAQLIPLAIRYYEPKARLYHSTIDKSLLEIENNKRAVKARIRLLEAIEPYLTAQAKPSFESDLSELNEYIKQLKRRTF